MHLPTEVIITITISASVEVKLQQYVGYWIIVQHTVQIAHCTFLQVKCIYSNVIRKQEEHILRKQQNKQNKKQNKTNQHTFLGNSIFLFLTASKR